MIKINIKRGNIVNESADAIVNAAKSSLMGGGGVDGAIHTAAGWEKLDEACEKIGGCKTGEAVITPAFDIKQVKYIIHTVGPFCDIHTRNIGIPNDKEKEALYNCYYNSLQLGDRYGCRSISFPSIATGIYGFPLEYAPQIFLNAVRDYEKENKNIETVAMVCFDEDTEKAFSTIA